MSKNTLLSELINYISYDGSGKISVTAGLTVNNGSNGRLDVLPDYAQNYFVSYAPGATSQSKLVVISDGISFRPGWGAEVLMDITSSGLVGIGGVAPSYLLDIYTATSATTSTILRLKNGFNDPSTGLRMRWDFASLAGAYLDVTTDSGGSKSMTLYLSAANAAPTQAFQILGSNKAVTFAGRVNINGAGDNSSRSLQVSQPSGYSSAIRILATTGTSGLLEFIGDGASSQPTIGVTSATPNNLTISTGGNPSMTITNTGYVGIGTTSPSWGLDIQGSASASAYLNITKTGYSTAFIQPYNDGVYLGSYNSYPLYLRTNNSTVMTLTTGGLVGIMTTSPNSGLHINSGATRGMRVDVNSGVQAISISPNGIFGIDEPGVGNGRFIIDTNGRVGIGAPVPGYKLDVNGQIYSNDTIYARNILPIAFATVTAGSPSANGIPTGYSRMFVNSLCDGNWRTILTSVNDTKAYFWASIGDAASKDTAQWFIMTTSPAYGVSNMGNINYQDNGWNTGGFDFQYINGGSGSYHLQIRTTSYYSSGNTASGNIYFLRME